MLAYKCQTEFFLLDVFGVQPNSESRVAISDGKPRSGEGRANWLNRHTNDRPFIGGLYTWGYALTQISGCALYSELGNKGVC